MTIKTDPAVAEYLARTKAALADLPAAEVEEIIEDIGPHLSEIAAELDEVSAETLSERLGTPEQYAAELRAAAGYPPRGAAAPARPSTLLPRLTLWGLTGGVLVAFFVGITGPFGGLPAGLFLVFVLPLLLAVALLLSSTVRIDELAGLSEAEAARRSGRRFVEALPARLVGFVRSLRPAWVVLRTIALAAAVLLGVARPELLGGMLLFALAALAVLLVFGSRARTDGRWRWAVAAANACALGVTLVMIAAVISALPLKGNNNDVYLVDSPPIPRNIYAFGPDGKPLTEVYLYDQDGNPINVWSTVCGGRYGEPTNKFPQPIVEFSPTGDCMGRIEPPFTVAIPRSGTPSAPSSAPSSAPPSAPSSAPSSAPPSLAPPTK